MTHFGLGSSGEDPWGSLFGGLGVGLLSQELVLSAWEAVLFPWKPGGSYAWLNAWGFTCLTYQLGCLPDLMGGCYLLGKGFPQQRYMWWPSCLLGRKHCCQGRGELPELLMSCFLPLREGEHLPGKLGMPLNCFLPQGEGEHQLGKLPDWVAWDATKSFPSPGGSWGPAWARLLPSPGEGEPGRLPACLPGWPEMPLSCFLPLWEGECLPGNELLGKLIDCFLLWGEGECLPEMPLNCFLPQGEGEHLPACLPGKPLTFGKSYP